MSMCKEEMHQTFSRSALLKGCLFKPTQIPPIKGIVKPVADETSSQRMSMSTAPLTRTGVSVPKGG